MPNGKALKALADTFACGYCCIDLDEIPFTNIVTTLTRDIGRITKTSLNVISSNTAKPYSLSRKYGNGYFPFHTDFAFRPRPPRILLLVNDSRSSYTRATLVARIQNLPPALHLILATSYWRLKTKSDDFFVSGLTRIGRNEIWRIDFDFLDPENEQSNQCKRLLPAALKNIEVAFSWRPRSALLIDNWMCAHARSPSSGDPDEGIRKITRFEVWQDARVDHRFLME